MQFLCHFKYYAVGGSKTAVMGQIVIIIGGGASRLYANSANEAWEWSGFAFAGFEASIRFYLDISLDINIEFNNKKNCVTDKLFDICLQLLDHLIEKANYVNCDKIKILLGYLYSNLQIMYSFMYFKYSNIFRIS